MSQAGDGFDSTEWVRVCAASELATGTHRIVDLDGIDAAVFNVGGEFLAIEDICSHDGAPLADGELDGDEIICPRHGSAFCLRSGDALTPPAYESIPVFPVRVEDGAIWVRDNRWDQDGQDP
jgi:3-phenylpropionate/trans-cinnamate dioxygenase ferredoxin subunit